METSHISDTSRFWPVSNCPNFLLINLSSPARVHISKKHNTFSQSFKHNSKMLHMIIKGLAIHQDNLYLGTNTIGNGNPHPVHIDSRRRSIRMLPRSQLFFDKSNSVCLRTEECKNHSHTLKLKIQH